MSRCSSFRKASCRLVTEMDTAVQCEHNTKNEFHWIRCSRDKSHRNILSHEYGGWEWDDDAQDCDWLSKVVPGSTPGNEKVSRDDNMLDHLKQQGGDGLQTILRQIDTDPWYQSPPFAPTPPPMPNSWQRNFGSPSNHQHSVSADHSHAIIGPDAFAQALDDKLDTQILYGDGGSVMGILTTMDLSKEDAERLKKSFGDGAEAYSIDCRPMQAGDTMEVTAKQSIDGIPVKIERITINGKPLDPLNERVAAIEARKGFRATK